MYVFNLYSIAWFLWLFAEVTVVVTGEKYVVTDPGSTLLFMQYGEKCKSSFGGETTIVNLLAPEHETEFLDQLGETDNAIYVFVWSPTVFTLAEYEKTGKEFDDYIKGRIGRSKVDMFPVFVGQAKTVRDRINRHLSLRVSGKTGAFSKQDPENRLAIDEPDKTTYYDDILSRVFMTRVELASSEEAKMVEMFLLYVFELPCNSVANECKLSKFDRKDVNNRGKVMQEFGTLRNTFKTIYAYARLFPQVAPYRKFFDILFAD